MSVCLCSFAQKDTFTSSLFIFCSNRFGEWSLMCVVCIQMSSVYSLEIVKVAFAISLIKVLGNFAFIMLLQFIST